MRSALESMLQAPPQSLPIADFCEELTKNMSLPQAKVTSFQTHVQEQYNVATAGDLQKIRQQQFETAVNDAGLNPPEALAIAICLGCATVPFQFPPDGPDILSKDESSDPDDDVPLAKWMGQASAKAPVGDQDGATTKAHIEMKLPVKKGGILKEAAQILTVRRECLDPATYNLPIEFQVEMVGSRRRNEEHLRRKIVQEIEAVCGDLYPSAEERSIILGKVEKECGPPTSTRAPHWDYWKDSEKKRHKGTAISDLERARLHPSKFGVSGKAWHGMMRPARPFVQRQGEPVLQPGVGLHAATPGGPASTTPEVPAGGASDRHTEYYDDGDFGDLFQEDHLRSKVKDLEEELARVKAEEEAKKNAKDLAKKAAAAARAADKKRKQDAAKENDGGNPPKATKSNQRGTRGRAAAPPEVESPAMTNYEKEREATITGNVAYIALIEKACAAGLEIMEDKMVAVLNGQDGKPSRFAL